MRASTPTGLGALYGQVVAHGRPAGVLGSGIIREWHESAARRTDISYWLLENR